MALPRLPILDQHRDTLEKCVYCPKLCRATCPVSNAEPSESLTPWGKMSAAYFVGRGDVPAEASLAASAWACTGCMACKERCDHGNEVATVLADARAGFVELGVEPAAARGVAARHAARAEEAAARARTLAPPGAPAKLLLGCGYLRHAPAEAALAVEATAALLDGPVSPVEACCGMPLLEAGDRAGFVRAAEAFAREVAGAHPLVALDPGCAHTVLRAYPRAGVDVVAPRLFVDVAAAAIDRLAPVEGPPVRYHDPCRLGRGLGRYDEPRRVLAKITGAPPGELQRHRAAADCSGAGGLLPVTMPEASRAAARARIGQHHEAGGGTLVTACAGSLRRFRTAGEPAEDLVTFVARSLGIAAASPPARDEGAEPQGS